MGLWAATWRPGLAALGVAAAVLGLSGCGGGSDVLVILPPPIDNGPSAPIRFDAAFDSPALVVSVVPPEPTTVQFNAVLSYNGSDPIGVDVRAASARFSDVDFDVSPFGSLTVRLTVASDLSPGTYHTQVQVFACLDAECSRQAPGSPASLPVEIRVIPQIVVESPAPLHRVGAEPLPAQVLAITAPPEAGELYMTREGDFSALNISLQDDGLHIDPLRMPAGQYQTQVEIRSRNDSRLRRSLTLAYTVEAPPGGELGLRATPAETEVVLAQGALTTRRFRIDPPTWTEDPIQVTLPPSPAFRDLRALGDHTYEVTFDATALALSPDDGVQSPWQVSVVATMPSDRGPLTTYVPLSLLVEPALRLSAPGARWEIDLASTTSDLRRTVEVLAGDGGRWPWRASSDSPWLRVTPASGVSGVDALSLEIDPSVLDLPEREPQARLTLVSDQPGTLPTQVPVVLINRLPHLASAAAAALTGESARLYIEGEVGLDTGLLAPGILQVDGARVVEAALELDSRFVVPFEALRLDLADLVPGQDVVVRVNAPLGTTRIALPAVGRPQVTSGFAALPPGDSRPPAYLAGDRSLVFARAGEVWRWPWQAAGWGAPVSRSVPGLIDIDPARDESALRGVTDDGRLLSLAIDRLDTLGHAPIVVDDLFQTDRPDAAAPRTLSVVRHAIDGRAYVAARSEPGTLLQGGAVGWLASCVPGQPALSALTTAACFGDPGDAPRYTASAAGAGAGVARSAGGGSLLMTHPDGTLIRYRSMGTRRETLPPVPPGRTVIAADDAGERLVSDDGSYRPSAFATATVALARFADAGLTTGGYAISGAGDYALVYAYRLVEASDGWHARDPQLLQIDLRLSPAQLQATPAPPPMAQVLLSSAVGCTSPAPSAAACRHTAHLLVAPGDRSAFVLGPLGVAATAVPAPVPAVRAQASPQDPGRRRRALQWLQPAR